MTSSCSPASLSGSTGASRMRTMGTYLNTELKNTDTTGGYMLICGVEKMNRSGMDRDDTGHAVAIKGHLDNAETSDLLDLFTAPRPASKREAKGHRKLAKSQMDLADSGEYGPAYSRHYRDNFLRFSHAAAVAETDQLWLPNRIATSQNGKAIVSIVTQNDLSSWSPMADAVIFRYIDCDNAATIVEDRFTLKKYEPKSYPFKQFSDFLCIDNAGERVLLYEYDVDSSTNSSPRITLRERQLDKGFPSVREFELRSYTRHGLVQDGGEIWVCCTTDYTSRGSKLEILEKSSGTKIDEIKLSREPVSLAVAQDGSVAACGLLGGAVWVVDLRTQKIRKFAPHIGAGRDDWSVVQLAQSNEFFISESEGGVTLTSLLDSRTANLGKLEPEIKPGESLEGVDTSTTISSTVAVLGDRVAITRHASVSALSADVSDYEGIFVSEAGKPGARKPVRVSRKAPIDEVIKKARLGAHKDTLLCYRSPAAIVRTRKLGKRGWSMPGEQHAPELGASRFGGWPDLPAGTEWPAWRQRPMAFLGQINLAEAAAAQPQLMLRKSGLLSFFLGCTDDAYTPEDDPRERFLVELIHDNEPGESNGWLVIYTPQEIELERQACESESLPQLFNPSLTRFQAGGKSFPDEQSCVFQNLEMSQFERADYVEMIGQLQSEHQEHQLMGYPGLIQFTPPEFFCEVQEFDFPLDTESDEYREFVRKASEWTLILQLDSDPKPDFMWGDGGKFYFYIRRSALACLDFSDTRIFFEN